MAFDTGAYLTRFKDFSSDSDSEDSRQEKRAGYTEKSIDSTTYGLEEIKNGMKENVNEMEEIGYGLEDTDNEEEAMMNPFEHHLAKEHVMNTADYSKRFLKKETPVVKEEQLSKDYADILKTRCMICNKNVEFENFRYVHLKKHGIELSEYEAKYGAAVPLVTSYHQCQICTEIFLFTRSRLATHLARHKISLREYGKNHLTKVKSEWNFNNSLPEGEIDTDCMFSNDYEDECLTACEICNKSVKFGNLGSHVYQSHGIRMRQYTSEHGTPEITKKSYHECAICHETLLFIRSQLVSHVKTKHNKTISEYNKAHMQLHNVEFADINVGEKGRKVGTQKLPQWCDGTMYKCPYCFTLYYRYFTFRIHLINSHNLRNTEERSLLVRENEILTDWYCCKICKVQVKRDRMDIEAHLKQAHRLTLKVYSGNFENNNIKVQSDEVVEKLVRNGTLMEPNKTYNSPKKIKIKSSGTKKLKVKSLTTAAVKAPPTITKARSSLHHTDSASEHSDSDPDAWHSIKRRKTGSSKTDKSLKISQVVSLAQEEEDDQQQLEVKTEKDSGGLGEVYQCPLYPCDWTCGHEDMKKGPAVLHLLKVHNIEPLEMRERGIKFRILGM